MQFLEALFQAAVEFALDGPAPGIAADDLPGDRNAPRPHLVDPFWSVRAAAELGWEGVSAPVQYRLGQQQLKRNLARQQQMALAV